MAAVPGIGDLAALVSRPEATGELFTGALHALRAVVPCDLAAIWRLRADRLDVVAAAGPLADDAVSRHTLSLARYPTVRRALEIRRPIPLEAHHHASVEGDPFDGLLDLPEGHSCMVVPLFAGEQSLGIITLDRSTCGVYPPEVVELAGVYGHLVALAMAFADQAARMDRYRRALEEQNRLLTEEAGGANVACQRLEASASQAMQAVVRQARQVARADLPVLIQGETGTGKEVLAQAIHAWGGRAQRPFVKINCAAIPENLLESELFGHVKGAFSGAERARPGRFVTADGGTLLLDEIGDMPLGAQTRLLRVLQEGAFEPVGSDRTVTVDVRVLAATHVDLEKAVAAGRFRDDLYYRLAVFPLAVPPLRERPEDVAAIAADFLQGATGRGGRGPWTLPPDSRAALAGAPWPGNVRQLLNVLERATILRPQGALTVDLLGLGGPQQVRAQPPPLAAAFPTLAEHERSYLRAALTRTGGQIYGVDGAAALVGLKPTTLQSRLKRLGLDRTDFAGVDPAAAPGPRNP